MGDHPGDEAVRPICDYEGSTYRTDFWEGQGREYEDLAERWALRRMLPPTGRRLLDIGAGFGRLADLYDGYEQVILLDYSRSQLEYARRRLGDERFIYVAADIYRLPLATSAVDTAVMVRVLHHLADVPAAFAQLARVIRPQGDLVLEFANKRHLKNVLRYLLRRGASPFTPDPVEFAPLHYDFQPAWVLARLAEAGLRPVARRSVSLFRAGALKRAIPARWLAAADGAVQRLTAAWAPAPSAFVRATSVRTGAPALASAAELFRCPACGHEPLSPAEEGLACTACGAHWPRENGVYLFK